MVGFPVSVHYKSPQPKYSGKEPEKELRKLLKHHNTAIYAIPEKCVLLYKNGEKKSIGEVYVFSKGKENKI